jgi:hypothetical protein
MRPFRVIDVTGPVHPVEAPCPECVAGYPVPCPRVIGGAVQATGFDALGRAAESGWTEEHCPGIVHAEIGPTGAIELRCAACGVMP